MCSTVLIGKPLSVTMSYANMNISQEREMSDHDTYNL